MRAGWWIVLPGLWASGCGRSPVVAPCAERIDQTAALTCEPTEQCEAPAFSIGNRPANALVVLDRSCSMAEQVDGRSKWSRAVEAVRGVVAEPRANLRWGLSLFPDIGGSLCEQGPIPVGVGPGQESLIDSLLERALERDSRYHPTEPCGTNLVAATHQALEQEPFAELDGRHHVVLISDGRHAGCPGRGELAVDNVAELRRHEISTVVVGFGGSEDTAVLQAMGEAGGMPASAEAAYHRAGLDDLGAVLDRVVQGLGCRHPLAIEVDDLPLVRVSFDGLEPVPADPSREQGWYYDGPAAALVLAGEPCARLLAGEVERLEVSLDCE